MDIKIIIKIDGEEIVYEKEVEQKVADRANVSRYARFFDETCTPWCKDSEHNKVYLRTVENQATDILKARGHLFLNEVYDMLGMARDKMGQMVGWIYDEKNPVGDNRVDFGLYEPHNKDFINGYNRIPLLDFNVDGIIWDKVP